VREREGGGECRNSHDRVTSEALSSRRTKTGEEAPSREKCLTYQPGGFRGRQTGGLRKVWSRSS